jgi:hypothetical protein
MYKYSASENISSTVTYEDGEHEGQFLYVIDVSQNHFI